MTCRACRGPVRVVDELPETNGPECLLVEGKKPRGYCARQRIRWRGKG